MSAFTVLRLDDRAPGRSEDPEAWSVALPFASNLDAKEYMFLNPGHVYRFCKFSGDFDCRTDKQRTSEGGSVKSTLT